ncbi:S9 family peptidase [Flavobacterium sp. Arc3]|jgi:dipeptidyl aminopeptidase/acylaminoacyl peptidase|uniref:alpha/beta hydrolase family protein n=1 Tax=unclassified Flavobacterium TaxID=196869 RepID=UPI00352D5EA7
MKKIQITLLACSFLLTVNTFAQEGKSVTSKLDTNLLASSKEVLDELASFEKGNYKYSVEDFFAKPKARTFRLSPNGEYMSYFEKDVNGKSHVYVKNTKTNEVTLAIEEKKELIRSYEWLNNTRLGYVMDKGGNENKHIYSANIDGTNILDLTPFEGVQASISMILKEQKEFIVVMMNKDNPQVMEPYKINITTGVFEKLYANADLKNPIAVYNFDKDGVLKGFVKQFNSVDYQYYYKAANDTEFKLVKEFGSSDTFGVLKFNYASENPDDAYVVTNLDSDKMKIVLYDLKQNKILKEIFSNETYDASIFSLSEKRNYELDYVGFNGEKITVIPLSKTFKKINKRLSAEFGKQQFRIVSQNDNEDKMLIIVDSDKIFGKYYQYDVLTDKINFMYDLMPKLKEDEMAVMQPITFKSRDGLTIHGYITLPKEAMQGKKVPLIVNPHGGPQGVRDSWGYNQESQLFASRGYATLHVNFRISGGYGKEFLKAGYNQIGRKVMEDIEDGVQYVLQKGWVDKNKIAIYGASHGGYATLMGLVKTPDLYACGVDYVGVSSIETFFSSFPEYWKPYKEAVKKIWYNLDNAEEAKIAKQVSPLYQVDKITKPLFVIQGANDPRVKMAESDQIVTALRTKGFAVPYMLKYNEGHGFAREENQIELYKTMMGFFAQHLN